MTKKGKYSSDYSRKSSASTNRSYRSRSSVSRSRSLSRERNNRRRNSSNQKYDSRKSFSKSPSRNHRRNRMNDRPEPCTCIGVFGLNKRTEERTLWETFDKFGDIVSVKLIMDKYQHESLGYGFINFKQLDSATRAVKEASGMNLDGKVIRVDYSITKKAHTPTPGYYMGKVSNRRNGRDFKRSRSRSYNGRRSPNRYSQRRGAKRSTSRSRSRSPRRPIRRRSTSKSYYRARSSSRSLKRLRDSKRSVSRKSYSSRRSYTSRRSTSR